MKEPESKVKKVDLENDLFAGQPPDSQQDLNTEIYHEILKLKGRVNFIFYLVLFFIIFQVIKFGMVLYMAFLNGEPWVPKM